MDTTSTLKIEGVPREQVISFIQLVQDLNESQQRGVQQMIHGLHAVSSESGKGQKKKDSTQLSSF